MGRKTNSKRSRLVALFAAILALVGAVALLPKVATAAEDSTCTVTVTKVTSDGDAETYQVSGMLHEDDGITETIEVKKGDTIVNTASAGGIVSVDGVELKNGESFTISGVSTSKARILDIIEPKTKGISTFITVEGAEVTKTITDETTVSAQITIPAGATNVIVTVHNMTPEVTTEVSPSSITPKSETETADITDAVNITGLTPGIKYLVLGALMDKSSTDTPIKEVTQEVTADENGAASATLTYEGIKVGELANKTLVAFAKVKEVDQTGDVYIAKHEDKEDAKQTVTITEIQKVGTLAISKTVKTEQADSEIAKATDDATKEKWEKRRDEAQKTEFEFTVELKDKDGKALEGEFAYTGASEGTISNGGTVKLKHGETITIADLPEGATYRVVETVEGSWKAEKGILEGSIAADTPAKADFVNAPLGTLQIIKVIDVSTIDTTINALKEFKTTTEEEKNKATDQATIDAYQTLLDETQKAIDEEEAKKAKLEETEFTFTVSLKDSEGKAYTEDKEYATVLSDGTKGTIKFEGGKDATVKLKGGQTLTVNGLARDDKVSVSETPVDGWTADHKKLSGTIKEGVTLTATFTNTYNEESNSNNNGNNGNSGSSTARTGTTSSSKLAATADPASAAALLAMAGAPVALAGAALRRKQQ